MQLTRSDNITEQNICLHAEWLKYYFIHIFKFVPNKKKKQNPVKLQIFETK